MARRAWLDGLGGAGRRVDHIFSTWYFLSALAVLFLALFTMAEQTQPRMGGQFAKVTTRAGGGGGGKRQAVTKTSASGREYVVYGVPPPPAPRPAPPRPARAAVLWPRSHRAGGWHIRTVGGGKRLALQSITAHMCTPYREGRFDGA